MACAKAMLVVAVVALFSLGASALDSKSIYDGCYDKKGCFGEPVNCTLSKDCKVVVTYQKDGDEHIYFQIQTNDKANTYVAVGLSKDDKMGDDSVVACARRGTSAAPTVAVETSVNFIKDDKKDNKKDATVQSWISKVEAVFEDDILQCGFVREADTEVTITTDNKVKFELNNEDVNLLLAAGKIKATGYNQHTTLRASPKKVKVTEAGKNLDAWEKGDDGAASLQASLLGVIIAALVALRNY